MSRLFTAIIALSGITLLAGCMGPQPKPNDPYYAPVLPRTPLPAAANNGSIYQAGFEQNLYGDRKAFRIGDIITITLNEKTAASKTANSKIAKTSSTTMGITSLFGSSVHAGDANLNAGYSGDRATNGNSQAAQGNSLTGSVTVTVADVLPNGILAVRGEKWMTLNTGEELVRIAGMIRADDIATDNTVSSNRVADARITYSGTGSFADASQTGWLDRFFLSPYWPF